MPRILPREAKALISEAMNLFIWPVKILKHGSGLIWLLRQSRSLVFQQSVKSPSAAEAPISLFALLSRERHRTCTLSSIQTRSPVSFRLPCSANRCSFIQMTLSCCCLITLCPLFNEPARALAPQRRPARTPERFCGSVSLQSKFENHSIH